MQIPTLITPLQLADACYLAHIADGRENETLLAHSQLTFRYYLQYCSQKGVDELITRLLSACGCDEQEHTLALFCFVHAIYLHDIGKINPRYQWDILHNKVFRGKCRDVSNSSHSLASSCIYINIMHKEMGESLTPKLLKLISSFAYCISRHHAGLTNGHDFHELESFDEPYYKSSLDREILEDIQCSLQDSQLLNDAFAVYLLGRLLYSLIVACDFCATQEYMTGLHTELAVIAQGGHALAEQYRSCDIYRGILAYQNGKTVFADKPINALRSNMFMEAERELLQFPDANIYYLEAPTGAGKTNMAINLALCALESDRRLNNIFYIFPFNTLVEQTAKILTGYFGDSVQTVNSITPVINVQHAGKEDICYEAVWLDHVFNNYPIVVTSHINLFNSLFGTGREQCFPLLKLCNSVVVLDEIQSYKNKIWREIISFLEKYAKLLNIKIIIMSATLPQLDKLLSINDATFVSLITDTGKYYQNVLFKDRVTLDFSLLDEKEMTLEYLKERVLEYRDKKVLIEFIKKKTARKFYLLCKEDCDVELLTGDDNAARRERIIDRAKGKESFLLVATQAIEAGVDIDMDIGFKDSSLFDSEEQFLGRINRSCLGKNGGKAFFFNFDDATSIYRKDVRLDYSIVMPEVRQWLIDKNFADAYESVMSVLFKKTSAPNSQNIINLKNDCAQLNFKAIEERMRLIDRNLQLFVPYLLHEKGINGYDVWQKFKLISSDKTMGYAQRKVELSALAQEMSYFTFTAYRGEEPFGVEEYLGYYYIPDGNCFIDSNGILDREALSSAYNGRFL